MQNNGVRAVVYLLQLFNINGILLIICLSRQLYLKKKDFLLRENKMLQAIYLQNIPLLDFFSLFCLCLGCFSLGHHESTVDIQDLCLRTIP